MDTFDLLKKLTETAGPSGFEGQISRVVQEVWRPLVNEISTDRVGNLIGLKQGDGKSPRRRIMLAAHMDEIALMVSLVEKTESGGFLRVTPVGGVDVRHLYGQLVIVHGRKELSGVIGSLPPSMLPAEKRSKPFSYEELVVDVGLSAEELSELVSIGDFVSFRQPLRKLLSGRVAGKALDNRASIVAVTACLEQLQDRHHSWDVVVAATAQEETRLLGAYTSGYAQQPDLAIAIDVGHGKGPGANEPGTSDLGGGPILDVGPNVHPGVFVRLQDVAKEMEMKVQVCAHERSSGTDAIALQISRAGVPTAVVSIPLRYMHTMVESLETADVERVGRLLAEFVCQLDADYLDDLAAAMMD